jgi:hypothetical protein
MEGPAKERFGAGGVLRAMAKGAQEYKKGGGEFGGLGSAPLRLRSNAISQ